MTTDEQEALSRRYSDDVIMLLPLSSQAVAVFNAARELCGIISWPSAVCTNIDRIKTIWHPPTKAPERPRPSLEDLGL